MSELDATDVAAVGRHRDTTLAELVAFVRENSPYYRSLYSELPDKELRLAELPVVDHAAYWAAHSAVPSAVATGVHEDGIVFATGGTTGAPRTSLYTRQEWRQMSRTFGTGLAAAGLRAGDRVANLFYAGELYSSFVFTLNCLQDAPVPTVQLPIAGSAPPEFTVRALQDHAATVIAAPPTSLCRLAREVVGSVGTLPGVRLALFSGEACYPDQLALLKRAFPGVAARSIGYASVDAGIVAAPVDGVADNRVHEVFADKIVELLDAGTGEPVTEPGRPGRIVLTDLARRLMPVIRYPVGDIGEWTDRTQRSFRLLGRAEEGARIGPVTVYLKDLHSALAAADTYGGVTGCTVVLRHRAERDELLIRLADDAGRTPTTEQALRRRETEGALLAGIQAMRPMLTSHVELGLVHPPAVEWISTREVAVNPRTGKAIRLLDERTTD